MDPSGSTPLTNDVARGEGTLQTIEELERIKFWTAVMGAYDDMQKPRLNLGSDPQGITCVGLQMIDNGEPGNSSGKMRRCRWVVIWVKGSGKVPWKDSKKREVLDKIQKGIAGPWEDRDQLVWSFENMKICKGGENDELCLEEIPEIGDKRPEPFEKSKIEYRQQEAHDVEF